VIESLEAEQASNFLPEIPKYGCVKAIALPYYGSSFCGVAIQVVPAIL